MIKKTHLYKEIYQQPQVLSELLDQEINTIQRLAQEIKRRNCCHIVIAARGTSDNAARYAKYLFAAENDIVVSLATPSLYTIYKQPPRFADSLVLGISQSGKSPDIVAVVAEARRQGALTAAITNALDSDLASEVECSINLHAGIEKSVAATKTYTSELTTIAMLSTIMASDGLKLEKLKKIPEMVAKTLDLSAQVARISERYRYMRHCAVIGRGYNYATAFELALKMKELTYTIAEPYSSADFMHGPMALVNEGFPAFVIAPSGMMLEEMRDFITVINDMRGETVVISDDEICLSSADIPLALPQDVPEWLSPITAIVPGQLFCLHLSKARKYDPDNPRTLKKITETW